MEFFIIYNILKNEEKYQEIIKELKNDLDKEKKFLKIYIDLLILILFRVIRHLKSQNANIIIHRAELEQILIDCINEVIDF